MPSPMPEFEPVTTAVFPVSCMEVLATAAAGPCHAAGAKGTSTIATVRRPGGEGAGALWVSAGGAAPRGPGGRWPTPGTAPRTAPGTTAIEMVATSKPSGSEAESIAPASITAPLAATMPSKGRLRLARVHDPALRGAQRRVHALHEGRAVGRVVHLGGRAVDRRAGDRDRERAVEGAVRPKDLVGGRVVVADEGVVGGDQHREVGEEPLIGRVVQGDPRRPGLAHLDRRRRGAARRHVVGDRELERHRRRRRREAHKRQAHQGCQSLARSNHRIVSPAQQGPQSGGARPAPVGRPDRTGEGRDPHCKDRPRDDAGSARAHDFVLDCGNGDGSARNGRRSLKKAVPRSAPAERCPGANLARSGELDEPSPVALRLSRGQGREIPATVVQGRRRGSPPRPRPGTAPKKRPHEAGAKVLRQVSYRQETYRAVPWL